MILYFSHVSLSKKRKGKRKKEKGKRKKEKGKRKKEKGKKEKRKKGKKEKGKKKTPLMESKNKIGTINISKNKMKQIFEINLHAQKILTQKPGIAFIKAEC